MSATTFRYLISLVVQNRLSMQLMDVVTAYLYGSLDSDIYMKVPDGISVPNKNAKRNMYCVKLKVTIWLKAVETDVVQPTQRVPSSERLLQ